MEGKPGTSEGLGLLDIATELGAEKRLEEISGKDMIAHAPFTGYLMHMGQTTGTDCARPMLAFDDGRHDGAMRADGQVMGCYAHGLFASAGQRAAWLARRGIAASGLDHGADVNAALDAIAGHLEAALDIDAIAGIAGL
jgi:adenosylcobyric acid synthase